MVFQNLDSEIKISDKQLETSEKQQTFSETKSRSNKKGVELRSDLAVPKLALDKILEFSD